MTTKEKTRKTGKRSRPSTPRSRPARVSSVAEQAIVEETSVLALAVPKSTDIAEQDGPPAEVPAEAVIEPTPRGPRNVRELMAAGRGEVELLSFRVGAEMFAIDLASVDEAVETTGVHPVPDMPHAMLGVLDLRGRLVPVFSPSSVLNSDLATANGVMLVMRSRDRRVGIAVDDVEDVIVLDMPALRHPMLDRASDGVLLGVATTEAGLVGIIDGKALVAACTGYRPPEAA